MKKLLLLFLGLNLSLTSFSQARFEIISTACDSNTLDTLDYKFAYNTDGGLNWGFPDMTLPENSIQGCLVMYYDPIAGYVVSSSGDSIPKSALGCDTNNFSNQDLTGKIAVMFRGTCEFGFKVYNAQKRGAIGVVIINYSTSPTTSDSSIFMSGGTYGLYDTIPVISLGRVDGIVLASCLDTVCNGVDGFMGDTLTTGTNQIFFKEKIVPYPNPTTNLLTIPIRKSITGNVLVEVFDLTGKLVLSENKTIGNEQLKLNVASIKNGAYVFNLTFVDGNKDVFKISVNR